MIKNNLKILFLFLILSSKHLPCEENSEILEIAKSWLSSLSDPQEATSEAFSWFYPVAHPRFNSILHFSYSSEITKHLDELIEKAAPKAPIAFWLDPKNRSEALMEALKNRNFVSAGCYPAMIWNVQSIDSPRCEVKMADIKIFHEILGVCLNYNEEVKQASLHLFQEKEVGEHYLIYLEGKPVGTGTLFIKNDIGMVFHIATLPEYQRRGLGRAMMEYIMNQAFQKGLKKLVLYSSHVAEKLYQNLGFQKVGEVEIYIREP